jgi:hypothetical protein
MLVSRVEEHGEGLPLWLIAVGCLGENGSEFWWNIKSRVGEVWLQLINF